MPFNVIYYLTNKYDLRDAISGQFIARGLPTPESVASYMVDYWKSKTSDPVPADLYERWYATASLAKQHPHSETRVVSSASDVKPTSPPKASTTSVITRKVRETPLEISEHIKSIISDLEGFTTTTHDYVRREEEEHAQKFPKDRGSVFIHNLYTQVEQRYDTYALKLVVMLQAMDNSVRNGQVSEDMLRLVHNADEFLQQAISRLSENSTRKELARILYLKFKVLKNELERLQEASHLKGNFDRF